MGARPDSLRPCVCLCVLQVAQQALGEGPIAQGLSNVLGGFLQPSGYSGRLNVSIGAATKTHPLGLGLCVRAHGARHVLFHAGRSTGTHALQFCAP